MARSRTPSRCKAEREFPRVKAIGVGYSSRISVDELGREALITEIQGELICGFTRNPSVSAPGTEAVSIAVWEPAHRSHAHPASAEIAGSLRSQTLTVTRSDVPLGSNLHAQEIILTATPEGDSLSQTELVGLVNTANSWKGQRLECIAVIKGRLGINAARDQMKMRLSDVSVSWDNAELLQRLVRYLLQADVRRRRRIRFRLRER